MRLGGGALLTQFGPLACPQQYAWLVLLPGLFQVAPSVLKCILELHHYCELCARSQMPDAHTKATQELAA